MKLYITGIAGLLGCNIVRNLINSSTITGVDIVKLDIPNISYGYFSLFDKDKLYKHIQFEKPDIIIHTAAAVNVDECEENPDNAFRINADITKDIAEICNELGIKMIYISSDSVFDGESEWLYKEEDATNPLNIYAASKLKGEEYVLKYPINLVFRTNIYGCNIQDKKSFGEWIVASLQQGQSLNMFDDIDFSPILVNDLADIILLSIKKKLEGLYHVCATGCISKYDFGVQVQKVFGLTEGNINRSQSKLMNFKAKRSKHMGMSNAKVSEALNLHIRTPEESIDEFYRLYKEYKDKEKEELWKLK